VEIKGRLQLVALGKGKKMDGILICQVSQLPPTARELQKKLRLS
jgi:hypothetical protein